jgi:hypothetical protein
MLAEVADDARLAALQSHADRIIEALQTAVADADAIIDEARQAVPGLDVYNPEQAASLRPEQAKQWVRARDASLVVDDGVGCWKQLATACGRTPPGGNYFALLLADLDAAQLDDLQVATQRVRDVIGAGHRLDLATPDELTQRITNVLAQRDQQTTDQDEAFAAGWRRTHGAGVA